MTELFITGTDTEIGKTVVTALLTKKLVQQGHKVAALKPIASGFELINGMWVNDDIEALKSASNVVLPDDVINSFAFKTPAAPHILAAEENRNIDFQLILDNVEAARKLSDSVLVEAVGGWQVPLTMNPPKTVADLALALSIPVAVVVGMRLGCINHALLTIQAVQRSGLELVGWVANCCESEMPYLKENIATINAATGASLLAVVPFCETGMPELDDVDFRSGEIIV